MKFDKSRVYTALNADELKVGSKIIAADDLFNIKESVLKHRLPKTIEKVELEDWEHRFLCDDDFHYAFAYLVEEPGEKKLEWTSELSQNKEKKRMKTKREVLEKFKKYGICEDIYCRECPFKTGVGRRCEIECTLVKLGAETMLESGDIEVKE